MMFWRKVNQTPTTVEYRSGPTAELGQIVVFDTATETFRPGPGTDVLSVAKTAGFILRRRQTRAWPDGGVIQS